VSGRELRTGSVDDLGAVMTLFDGAIAWLVEHGRTGQWGDQPWSGSADRVARIRRMMAENEVLVVEQEGAVIGALVHGPTAHDYVPPADGPEDYVLLLVADRGTASRGAGRALLDEAWSRARARGVRQRVDCYAGGDGALVRFYESAGFTRTETFDVSGWPGQLLERRA
jgi:ribosomal protein S18 acetylase RimI-like enzyme